MPDPAVAINVVTIANASASQPYEEKINYDQVRKEAMIVDRENIRQEMKEIDSSLKQHLGMDREEYNAKYYFGGWSQPDRGICLQPGYWQIPLTERSKQFTAFSIPNAWCNIPIQGYAIWTEKRSFTIHSSADLTQWMDDIESLDDDILELDNSPISSPTREKEDAVPPIQEPPINLLSMITVEDVLAEMTPDHLCYQRREFERTYQEYMNLAWI
ncbi:hypothetical protein V9T40_011324 [Parthenolecanium corni]|uniref:Uncharacterized protein n=1 Tax=Parthenolecanium corni TaxID=536013 RepID=A0AAN9T588_9HEMI